jgi:hypothetical protein
MDNKKAKDPVEKIADAKTEFINVTLAIPADLHATIKNDADIDERSVTQFLVRFLKKNYPAPIYFNAPLGEPGLFAGNIYPTYGDVQAKMEKASNALVNKLSQVGVGSSKE